MEVPEWYVIQVQAGREEKACEVIKRSCESYSMQKGRKNILLDCFSPIYEFRRKIKGAWIVQSKLLLPGYAIAVTSNPWQLSHILNTTNEFAKILSMNKTFIPLSTDDRSWMEQWVTEGDHAIPISFAYKEGDSIVVTEGPLLGREAIITKVNRRKRVANVEIHAGQLTIHTTVGLELLSSALQTL